ncbi:MAG: DUF3144 domain-containing protein [Chromatiaceae bacterium]|nr:DUF3144 domain-containing protein [Gammaproteobacteria bacterium]MCP5305429.1 DUF3144 domain-containing protein [Chromatiaceae bacterium]MCP5315388.1 DUF3144 domain-containing protein [Chromatiaceae bacterium]
MTDESTTTKKVEFSEVQDLAKRFIDLANEIKNEGRAPDAINGALMFASCIYATYSAAGNEGYLHDSGVAKVVEVYRRNLATLQKLKKAQSQTDTA